VIGAHGYFEFSIVDQIQIGACSGDWNEEGAIECCINFKSVVNSINDKPWASISDIRGWGLGVPETEKHFQKLHLWSELHNQTHKVIISSSSIQLNQIDAYQKVWDKVKVYYANNIDDAINWLKKEKFEFNESQVKTNFLNNEKTLNLKY
jgi:hypothetical protein